MDARLDGTTFDGGRSWDEEKPGGELQKIISIQLVMMSETGEMQSMWLPGQPEGKYLFPSSDGPNGLQLCLY